MRNRLACLAALVLATSTLTTQIADACGGGYEARQRAPQVLSVSRHSHIRDHVVGVRSFALLRGSLEVQKTANWAIVAPGTYENAQLASLGRLAKPLELTVFSSQGVRVFKAQQHVALKYPTFQSNDTFDAIELPTRGHEEIMFALVGDYSTATWHRNDYRYTNEQGIHDTTLIWTRSFRDGRAQFELADGDRKLGIYPGTVKGALDIGGLRYVVASDDSGTARLIRV
jgi:hypothetical protein